MGRRIERVSELIKREISLLLREERIRTCSIEGLISITEVEVSKDLRHGKVFVSIYGESNQEGVIERLNKASGYIQYELGKRIELRYIPKLQFLFDPSLEQGERILSLLNQVQKESSHGEQKTA